MMLWHRHRQTRRALDLPPMSADGVLRIGLFEDGGRWAKALRKERVPAQYERLTAELFRSVPLRVRPREVWRQEGKL